ncbi:trypsin-like serine protease [Lichenifustis flavocetrariae]|uniref:Trypsin-like serine protease n=1 Tax=Lichenifustis flavocetrariae TaxID=2949735 RepID=A0AA41ZAP8_9HYPH|nr:trypsin-like serine protease [Lichenifustis flavocetrariae]MCW6512417.1 trypsin-like serine protease [Lichenifustis flavocetrariae]
MICKPDRRSSLIGLSSGSALSLVLTIAGASPAHAILTRADYASNSSFSRYVNLGNDARFATVGAVYTSFGGQCSGSLISASIVMTAAHCLTSEGNQPPVFAMTGSATGNAIYGSLTSGVSVAFIGGPTLKDAKGNYAPQYSTYADSVAIFSGYNDFADIDSGALTNSGDIALIHITSSTGPVPRNYLPVNTSRNEINSSGLTIGTLVGYGNTGNGIDGEIAHTNQTKLGAQTTVKTPLDNVVAGTFLDPRVYPVVGLPADFLQGALGSGDSGGPLVANVAGVDTIIGVASVTGNDHYGEQSDWTRTSSFPNFISDASAALNSSGPVSVSGSTASNPLLTFDRNADPQVSDQRFFIYAPDGFTYFNVDGSNTEDVLSSGLLIDAVQLSSSIGEDVSVWEWDPVLGIYVDSGSDIGLDGIFKFGHGVDRFRLTGLLDEPSIFGLDFDKLGFTEVTWTGDISAVPLPPAFALFGCGLLILGTAANAKRFVRQWSRQMVEKEK